MLIFFFFFLFFFTAFVLLFFFFYLFSFFTLNCCKTPWDGWLLEEIPLYACMQATLRARAHLTIEQPPLRSTKCEKGKDGANKI